MIKMKTIQITMPEELEKSLDAIAGDRDAFIVETIKKRLEDTKSKRMEKLLVEGYKASRDEARQLSKEFNKIDLEHWDEY